MNTILAGMIMKPRNKRKQTKKEAQDCLQPMLTNIADLQTSVLPLASLPGGDIDLLAQFVITSILPFEDIYLEAMKIVDTARKAACFFC